MDMNSYIFLIISSLSSAVSGAIQITTHPTNASLQRSVSLICLTDEPYVQFRRLPGSSVCVFTGAYTNGSCKLAGSYITEYIYTCNIVNNYTVTIPGFLVTEQLHGTQWSCQNPFDPSTHVVTRLFVNIPISSIQIAATPVDNNPVEINNGTSQYFKCTTSSGRPSSRIQWYISNINLTSDATVQPDVCSLNCSDGKVISSSVLEYIGNSKDDGKYIYCSALNTYDMEVVRSQNVSIIILYGPQQAILSPPFSSYNVNETDSIGPINCTSQCNPPCTILWNGPKNHNSTTSVLNLQNIDRRQSGEYHCVARNIVNSVKSIAVTLTVNYGPRQVIISPPYQSYSVNETANIGPISCTADCKPVCQIIWNGPNLASGTTHVLNLQNMSRNQTGEYYCTAGNIVHEMVSSILTIEVNYGPQKVDISPSAPFYVVNETTDLDPILCAADCKPECKITWNGPNIPSNTYSVLFLQNITINQTGDYYCKASNSFGSATSIKVYVSVNYAPYGITLSPSTHAYIVNETGNLGPIICTAECLPKCNIIWKGPNIPSDANSKLTLKNISRNQEGKYHCIANNYLGDMVSLTVFVGVYYPCIRCNAAQNGNDVAIFKAGISSLVIGILMILITIVANCFIHGFRKPKRKEDSRSNDYVQARASNPVYTGVYDNAGQDVSNADSVTKTSVKGASTDTNMYEELQQNTKSKKEKHIYQTLQEHGKGDDSRKNSQYVNLNF